MTAAVTSPVPTELAAILAKVDLLTRMLPQDLQRDVFWQVLEAHRLGRTTGVLEATGIQEVPNGR
jgi:hypothetical protein